MEYAKNIIKCFWGNDIMKKILFVCHGNICRSPMAEFVLKDMVKKKENRKKNFLFLLLQQVQKKLEIVCIGEQEKN